MALDKAKDKYDIATKANIPWLTNFQWKDHIITEEMIQRTASGGIGGYDSLKQFTRKSGVRITEEAFCAAVKCFDHEMIRLLLQTGANITQEIIEAAATNKKYSRFVIDLLLESQSNFEITAKLVKLAADNPESGKDVMEIILRKANTDISEEAMVAIAARFDTETVNLVLNTRDNVKITSAILSGAIKEGKGHGRQELLDFLLERLDQETSITEEVIHLVAKKGFKNTMMILLNRWGDKIVVTDRIFEITTRWFDDEAIELLFDRQGDQITITEGFLKIAASPIDTRMMQILLDNKGDQVNITEEVVKIAAKNYNHELKITTTR
ncbi:hypothetical protein THARTR1_05977 [Trichoderma harzianum]|uniref:Ankyrin repeat protein n=1 Tax=Trichoderma harzianum TaxID=5544 RepID=A0A2K0U680_TRIHA|nr:hypothetical protein THARTR1_05977 [Trichoderma harzianum]